MIKTGKGTEKLLRKSFRLPKKKALNEEEIVHGDKSQTTSGDLARQNESQSEKQSVV